MNQHKFVEGCLSFYAKTGTEPEPGGEWQEAHYPIPECLGGTDKIWMLFDHHQEQGLYQSEEFGCACFFNGDVKKFLDRNPTRLDLWDLYEKWRGHNTEVMKDHPNSREGWVRGGNKTVKIMNDHPNTVANRPILGKSNVVKIPRESLVANGEAMGPVNLKAMNCHHNTLATQRKNGGRDRDSGRLSAMREEAVKKVSKPVLCIENGQVYLSARDAERKTGVSNKRISDCCIGKKKVAGGLHWLFYKEVPSGD